MKIDLITIFPNCLDDYFSVGILARALKNKIWSLKYHNPRQFATDKHQSIDDRPFGGGAGMVMMAEPLIKTIQKITKNNRDGFAETRNDKKRIKIIMLTPRGKKLTQKKLQEYSKLSQLVIICGRYEGIDERVTKFVDEQISIGDYVLSGGEIAAGCLIDGVIRLLPKVAGNAESIKNESFNDGAKKEYPQYTRPEVLVVKGKKYRVPRLLLSGHHKKIIAWREGKKK